VETFSVPRNKITFSAIFLRFYMIIYT